MLSFFKSLFSAKGKSEAIPIAEPVPHNPIEEAPIVALRPGVDEVMKLDITTDELRASSRGAVLRVLKAMDTEFLKIKKAAGNYPANPINAAVWFDGVELAAMGTRLTHHFKDAGWLEMEICAAGLWAKATLAVCSHYHHMVGPAMIAIGDCQDRMKNPEGAATAYTSVICDFCDVSDWMENPDNPTETDRVALQCLQTSVERMLSRGQTEFKQIELEPLRVRVVNLLAIPVNTEE